MSADQITAFEQAITNLTKGDKPFMVLFCLIMIFVIYMAIKVMGYVRSVSSSHNEQIMALNDNMKEQRESHFKLVVDEQKRSDKRERELFSNLERNTHQLEGVAAALKEVQVNFVSLEHNVTANFSYLEREIENVKDQITKKEQR